MPWVRRCTPAGNVFGRNCWRNDITRNPCERWKYPSPAELQNLQPHFDATFSAASFSFRPGRSAHQAIELAREHIASGSRWVVDMDLEQFFERVNHDVLMARLARRIADKRILHLIRRSMTAGMKEGGLVSQRSQGPTQGGPLSPLLSNVLLDELDRELERRGHRFVRYADDCAPRRRERTRLCQSEYRHAVREMRVGPSGQWRLLSS